MVDVLARRPGVGEQDELFPLALVQGRLDAEEWEEEEWEEEEEDWEDDWDEDEDWDEDDWEDEDWEDEVDADEGKEKLGRRPRRGDWK